MIIRIALLSWLIIPYHTNKYISSSTEIPRVITALQQQNTAPEVQQYDADPYQTDDDNDRGEIISHTKLYILVINGNKFSKRESKFRFEENC